MTSNVTARPSAGSPSSVTVAVTVWLLPTSPIELGGVRPTVTLALIEPTSALFSGGAPLRPPATSTESTPVGVMLWPRRGVRIGVAGSHLLVAGS